MQIPAIWVKLCTHYTPPPRACQPPARRPATHGWLNAAPTAPPPQKAVFDRAAAPAPATLSRRETASSAQIRSPRHLVPAGNSFVRSNPLAPPPCPRREQPRPLESARPATSLLPEQPRPLKSARPATSSPPGNSLARSNPPRHLVPSEQLRSLKSARTATLSRRNSLARSENIPVLRRFRLSYGRILPRSAKKSPVPM